MPDDSSAPSPAPDDAPAKPGTTGMTGTPGTPPEAERSKDRPAADAGGDAGPERELWAGTSSQVVNFWWFVACILIIPIPWAIWKWLVVRCRRYALTTERLRTRYGVLNKATDYLELYRVRDIRLSEPFWYRLFGVGNVVMETSDRTHPMFVLPAIGGAERVAGQIREQVELMRSRRNVREVDFQGGEL